MNRRRLIKGAAVLAGAGLYPKGDSATAQPAELHSYLPAVFQSAGSTLVTLVEADCGFVAAVVVPGTPRVILGYIIRPNGNLLHIAEDMGDHLEELDDPLLAALLLGSAQGPAFTFPGPKQGTCALVIVGGQLLIYATSRVEETGPFMLRRLSMPVPAVK